MNTPQAGHGGAPVDTVFRLLGDSKQIERQKGIDALRSTLNFTEPAPDPAIIEEMVSGVSRMLAEDAWEKKLGGLCAAKELVSGRGPPALAQLLPALEELLLEECLRLLEDPEVRVRLEVSELLLALSRRRGVEVYDRCHARVLQSIHENFDREGEGDKASTSGGYSSAGSSPRAPSESGAQDLLNALLTTSYRPARPGTGEMRHGTEGWHCLETSMRALQRLVEGAGAGIAPRLTPELRALLLSTLHHPNRFVREGAHGTVAALCGALPPEELQRLGRELAPLLADGLSDNWSQVRYCACVSTRAFLERLQPEQREPFFPVLLPPMCLNRYYVAEGVRRHIQETWRQVTGDKGREFVAHYIDQVVEYYLAQAKTNNHVVRESACNCVAELADKVDRAAVAPHVPRLMRVLLFNFKDISWPVRDAACTACGRCAAGFPAETAPQLEHLLELWADHLSDNIPTVREDAALAVAAAAGGHGAPVLLRIGELLEEMLPRAREQLAMPRPGSYGPQPEASATGGSGAAPLALPPAGAGQAFGPARPSGAVDGAQEDLFGGESVMARFSASHLLKGDGCEDFGLARPKDPWEFTDGAVYLLRELALLDPDRAAVFVPQLADVAALSGFAAAPKLRETVWGVLPVLATRLGKARFKPLLPPFLRPLFGDLRCGQPLTEVAAGKCAAALRDWLGPRIFAARLDEQQVALMAHPNVPQPASLGGGPGLAWPPPGAYPAR